METEKKKINIKMYVLLILITLLLKVFQIELIFGMLIDLSSIAIILIFMIYGKRKAITVSIIACLINILFFNGKYIELLQIVEILGIYILSKKYKQSSIMVLDIAFWTFIGMPILYLIYFIMKKEAFNEYHHLTLAFMFINYIFNVFISEVLYVYHFKKKLFGKKIRVTFRHIILHILTASILIPFVINIFVDIVKADKNISSDVNISAQEVFDNISDELKTWKKANITNLQLSGAVETIKIQESIKTHSKYKPFNIHIKNSRDKIIVDVKNNSIEITNFDNYEKHEIYNENLYKMVPISESYKVLNNDWIDGFFIYHREIEENGFTVMIEIPIGLYKDRILAEYASQFKFLLFFIIFIFIIAMLFNRTIFNDLSTLSYNTNDVEKLLNEEDILWPDSNIVEIKGLIGNVKKMVSELRYNFVELKRSEEMLYELAYYDTLTTLPNRLFFKKALDELIGKKVEDEKISVIFLDLNRFKIINDTLGHDVGDKLLVEVALRLSELRSDNLKIFRLGGDEFVILANINNIDDLEKIGQDIASKFKENFTLDDVVLNISCSIGASIYPDHSDNMSNIIQYADIAMYRGKENNNKDIQIFNDEMKDSALEKLFIEKYIFNALEKDEFTLYYQPKYDIKNEEIKSLEALIRWTSKEIGVVSPDKFISIAEESDLILKIDKWVMIKACKENKRLQDEGYKKIPVSVNISAKHFLSNEIERLIEHALEVSGLEAKYLIIEITEGVLIKNFKVVEEIIQNLNKIGVAVSIDDFGKGYSSFNQLIRLPINEIKIDKSFISDIEKDSKRMDIVKIMVELAHKLNLNVVAEGIETEEERNYVKNIGCDELQGYLFAKPTTIDKIKNLLSERV